MLQTFLVDSYGNFSSAYLLLWTCPELLSSENRPPGGVPQSLSHYHLLEMLQKVTVLMISGLEVVLPLQSLPSAPLFVDHSYAYEVRHVWRRALLRQQPEYVQWAYKMTLLRF